MDEYADSELSSFIEPSSSRGKKNKENKLTILSGRLVGQPRKRKPHSVFSKNTIVSICFLIILSLGYFHLFKRETRDNLFTETLFELQNHTAMLNRVINAIFLQNELQKGSISMIDVVAGILGVENVSLFNSIDEVSIRDSINLINKMHLVSNHSTRTIDEPMQTLNERAKRNLSDVSFARIEEFNSTIHIPKIKTIAGTIEDLNNTLTALQSSFSKLTDVDVDSFLTTLNRFPSLLEELKPIIDKVATLEDLLHRLDSDWLEIKALEACFKVLEPSVPDFGVWLNSSYKTTKVQLDVLKTVFSPIIPVSSRSPIIIGFPNKSKDLDMLAKDFENKWLKEMLNKGSSLDELMIALTPVLSISSKLPPVEEELTKPMKIFYFEIVQQALRTIRNADKWNAPIVFQSFSQANNEFTQQLLANNFNASDVDNVKNILNSRTVVNDVKNDLSYLFTKALRDLTENDTNHYFTRYQNHVLNGTDRLNKMKDDYLTTRFRRMFDMANEKMQELVSKLDEFGGLLSNVLEYKPFITKLINVPIDPKIKDVANYANVLKIFWPYTTNQLKELEKLKTILLPKKKTLIESQNLEPNLKQEIDWAIGSEWLKSFSSVREAMIQLAFSHKTLGLYLRPDFHPLINKFVNNVTKLAEKIGTVSAIEKQWIGSGWSNITWMGRSLKMLSTKIKKLPSKVTYEKVDFRSFINGLSILNKVKIPLFDFPMMHTTLEELKSTGIGKSREIVDIEHCLYQLEDLQYAAMRRNDSLLITDAQVFFEKSTDPKRLWLWISLGFDAVLILCITVLFAVMIRIHSTENHGTHVLFMLFGDAQAAEKAMEKMVIEEQNRIKNESRKKKMIEDKKNDERGKMPKEHVK
uniref:WSN domain-containing protein n=1 Tax=Caenorhabditis japonica TaxID=281687 RepID=A0A8R1DME8_CAEJA